MWQQRRMRFAWAVDRSNSFKGLGTFYLICWKGLRWLVGFQTASAIFILDLEEWAGLCTEPAGATNDPNRARQQSSHPFPMVGSFLLGIMQGFGVVGLV